METTELKTTILNDLIQINNDRIAGYEKAISELKAENSDLTDLFNEMINESNEYKIDLATLIATSGGNVETGTTTSGKIYRAWMDLKAVFTGNDRKSILSNCEFGEDAAQKAYRLALEETDLSADVRSLIADQKQKLRLSHDRIRALRDAAI